MGHEQYEEKLYSSPEQELSFDKNKPKYLHEPKDHAP